MQKASDDRAMFVATLLAALLAVLAVNIRVNISFGFFSLPAITPIAVFAGLLGVSAYLYAFSYVRIMRPKFMHKILLAGDFIFTLAMIFPLLLFSSWATAIILYFALQTWPSIGANQNIFWILLGIQIGIALLVSLSVAMRNLISRISEHIESSQGISLQRLRDSYVFLDEGELNNAVSASLASLEAAELVAYVKITRFTPSQGYTEQIHEDLIRSKYLDTDTIDRLTNLAVDRAAFLAGEKIFSKEKTRTILADIATIQEALFRLRETPAKAHVRTQRALYAICHFIFRQFEIGVYNEIDERQRIMPKRVIIAANHQSVLDTFVIMGYFGWHYRRNIRSIGVLTPNIYLRMPIIGRIFSALGGFNAKAHPYKPYGIEYARTLLDENASILIYPEGRPAPRGESPLRHGVVAIAAHHDTDVIPVRINWSRKHGVRHFKLSVGIPISGDNITPQNIMDHIYSLPLA